jgi:hypothetical protein
VSAHALALAFQHGTRLQGAAAGEHRGTAAIRESCPVSDKLANGSIAQQLAGPDRRCSVRFIIGCPAVVQKCSRVRVRVFESVCAIARNLVREWPGETRRC